MAGKDELFGKRTKIIYFVFRNNLFHKNTVGENGGPSLHQKEKCRSAKSDVSKVSFPDTGKITNQEKQEEKPYN